jgi:hypothetical protein
MKVVGMTDDEKRRAVIQDLLIGVGIPVLQMIARECAQLFTVNQLSTRMRSRICCFSESLHDI